MIQLSPCEQDNSRAIYSKLSVRSVAPPQYLPTKASHQRHRPTMADYSKPSDSTKKDIYMFEQENGTFERQVSSFRSWISSKPGAQFPPEKDRYVSRRSPVLSRDTSDLKKGPLHQSRMPLGVSGQSGKDFERSGGNHPNCNSGLGAVPRRMVRFRARLEESLLDYPGPLLAAMVLIPSTLSMASLVFANYTSKQSQTIQHVSQSRCSGTRRVRRSC